MDRTAPTPAGDDPEPILPTCRATVDRIQLLLDGTVTIDIFDTDAHLEVCSSCRERLLAAQSLIAAFTTPAQCVTSTHFTDAIVTAVCADPEWNSHRVVEPSSHGGVWDWRPSARVLAPLAGVVVAACTLIAVTVSSRFQRNPEHAGGGQLVATPTPTPTTEPSPETTPAVRPVRIGDELGHADQALKETLRPIATAQQSVANLAASLTRPPLNPVNLDLTPAGRSLAEIPDAARTGLQPVTSSAQKAFNRLLRDVNSIQPSPVGKPNT